LTPNMSLLSVCMASFVNIMRYAQDAKRSGYARNIAGGRVAFAALGWRYLNANYRSLRIPAAVGHHVSLLRFFRRWRYFIYSPLWQLAVCALIFIAFVFEPPLSRPSPTERTHIRTYAKWVSTGSHQFLHRLPYAQYKPTADQS
jgi:hypothetical protein